MILFFSYHRTAFFKARFFDFITLFFISRLKSRLPDSGAGYKSIHTQDVVCMAVPRTTVLCTSLRSEQVVIVLQYCHANDILRRFNGQENRDLHVNPSTDHACIAALQ